MSDLAPVVLGPNQPQRFYRGGEKIAAFRAGSRPEAGPGGEPGAPGRSLDPPGPGQDASYRPEDWVGSATTVFGSSADGLTRLPDGRLLRDAIEADPEGYLGPGHVRRHGSSPAMLRALNRVAVRPGDAILVPAGLPHAIGAGVFVVELQEPTDLSVLLEWDAFPIDGRAEGHLGLGFGLALGCVDRSAWQPAQIAGLRGPDGVAAQRPVTAVFPPAADPYFAAQRIRPGLGAVRLDPGFAILIVTAGRGLLCSERDDIPLSRGMTVLVPHAAGHAEITGPCELIRCLPPNGSAPDSAPDG